MSVKQFKYNPNGSSASFINIPISLDFIPVDQAEVVEMDFVSKEMEEVVNPIIDYEQARFIPTVSNGNQVNTLTYRLNLLNGIGNMVPATYGIAGFANDDLIFNKSRFNRSFVRLSFYDSDVTTNQNLVYFQTLFCRLTSSDYQPLRDINNVPIVGGGLPYDVANIDIRFELSDPIINPEGVSEGYYVYQFKDEVAMNMPNELYMRASWNNAATGESIGLVTDPTPQDIRNLSSKLHTRYLLRRDNTGYFYQIDESYSSPMNVSENMDNVTVQLYQIQVL